MSNNASHTQRADKPSLFQTIKPVLVLVAICAVAGALLGLVHSVSEPVALARVEQEAQRAYAQLIPEASKFEEVPCDVEGCTGVLRALDAQGSQVGSVVVAESKGYGGEVVLMVAFDEAGTVSNIVALANEETPGLGTKVEDESYIGQYVGKPAQTLDEGSVDLISGATISSKAALAAFNIAVQAYSEVS